MFPASVHCAEHVCAQDEKHLGSKCRDEHGHGRRARGLARIVRRDRGRRRVFSSDEPLKSTRQGALGGYGQQCKEHGCSEVGPKQCENSVHLVVALGRAERACKHRRCAEDQIQFLCEPVDVPFRRRSTGAKAGARSPLRRSARATAGRAACAPARRGAGTPRGALASRQSCAAAKAKRGRLRTPAPAMAGGIQTESAGLHCTPRPAPRAVRGHRSQKHSSRASRQKEHTSTVQLCGAGYVVEARQGLPLVLVEDKRLGVVRLDVRCEFERVVESLLARAPYAAKRAAALVGAQSRGPLAVGIVAFGEVQEVDAEEGCEESA